MSRKAYFCPECDTEMIQSSSGLMIHVESSDCVPEPWPDLLSVATRVIPDGSGPCQCDECREVHADFIKAFGKWPDMSHAEAMDMRHHREENVRSWERAMSKLHPKER